MSTPRRSLRTPRKPAAFIPGQETGDYHSGVPKGLLTTMPATRSVVSITATTTTPTLASSRPQANQYVLGIATLWLLIPALHGLAHRRHLPLSVCVLATCAVSTAMWRTHVRGSFLHTADLCCSRILFGLLLHHTGGRPPLLPVGAACLYVLCELLMRWPRSPDYDAAMWSHLAFRFLGYWWTHIAIIGYEEPPLLLRSFGGGARSASVSEEVEGASEGASASASWRVGVPYVYTMISVAYWGHIFASWRGAKRQGGGFVAEHAYLGGCARLCALIAAVGSILPFFRSGEA